MLFFMELKFYKKFSKFSMELEYHRKLEFPISDKFLYISEKVINCNFFFFKNSSIWLFRPRNGSFLQSLDYFWRPTCRTHSQQIILKEWTTLATWILDLLDFNSQRLNPSNRGGLDPTKIAALPSFAYLGDVKVIPFCKHVFHPNCLDKWLSAHVTCPVCRSRVWLVKEDLLWGWGTMILWV